MNKNKFDLIMDYIDVNINLKPDEIKKGMFDFAGVNSNTFNHCLRTLTGKTLKYYIICRKLYFASEALYNNPDANIVEVALEYYSDQSAFNRAMKYYYNCTPGEIKSGMKRVPDEKPALIDFCDTEDTKIGRIYKMFEEGTNIRASYINYLMEVEQVTNTFGFDIDTTYAIAELSERLEVPLYALAEACFKLEVDCELEREYHGELSPEEEIMVYCGIESQEEADKICDYYNISIYELDRIMVIKYYESQGH